MEESAEDKLSGYVLLHNLDDVFNVVTNTKESNTLIMGSDAVDEFFTPESFTSFLKNVRRINPILIVKSKESEIVPEDFIYEKMSYANNPRDMLTILAAHPRESYTALKRLSGRVQQAKADSLNIASRVSEMQHKVSVLEADKTVLEDKVGELQSSLDYYSNMFSIVKSRLQHKFLSKVEDDSLNFCTTNDYDRVLYFKEISHLPYTFTLLEMLQQITLMLYQTPCRICVIEGYGATLKRFQYPNLVSHRVLTVDDIIKADILMEGYQPTVMDGFMHNASGSSVAIVLDREGSDFLHIQGANVQTYFIVGNWQDVATFNLPKDSVISVPKVGCMCIPAIEGFEDMTASERITAYSNLRIVSQILSR